MSPVREPSTPPNIQGYDFESNLGSGGYADVFLYTRAMPKMQVAIKVLLHTSLSSTDLSRFTAEANAMAALASHPFIVPILGADVAPDGRPYIVMRYYPGGNLSARVRREPLSVVEALRIGIEISSAVESAHRVGILHRDIKPANILISEFGQPGLTDFGISLNDKSASAEREEGLSIPWSPPEAFGDETTIARTGDVYSLAATVYTLLTGRSPFEVPGGSNKQIDLIQRIEKSPPPSTGRADVPESLERY
ncbi:MAG: serine/threonine protein kinase [Acidimicrobiales bacterium]|nr:serine/threonine protein kinase [Acidimicrobiales bacterium]